MEVSGRKADKLGVTVTKASQEDSELACDPCFIEDGHHVPVIGFCVDCQHYLCDTCYKCHCRPLPMKKHVLLDIYAMQQKKNATLLDALHTEKCTKHDGKSIKYLCKPHNQLGCGVCMINNHRACDDVKCIADISEGIEESAEYKDFITEINRTKEQFQSVKNKSDRKTTHLKTCFARVIDDMRKLRKAINEMFDELENEIEKEANSINHGNIEKMSTISATCDKALQDIQTLNSDLELLQKSKQYQQLFIKMKKTQTDMKMMEDNLGKVTKENKTSEYKFVPDEKINEIMKNLKAFGKLTKKKNPEDFQVKHIQDIQFTYSSKYRITSSTIMSDGQLVLTDHQNKKVILFNIKQNKIKSQLQLSSGPWDITETNQNELAVTLYRRPVIQFVSASDTLSIGHELKINGECQGILCYMDKLAVTFTKPARVEIMEMNGNVLNVISTNVDGRRLFSDPCFMAISPDQTTLYVSDWSKNSMTSLTLDGEVLATYTDNDLKNPTGVCVDRDGTIYVCGCNSNNVHVITADGEKQHILLQKTDGVTGPWFITYSDQDDTLYIGMGDDASIVKVYHFQ